MKNNKTQQIKGMPSEDLTWCYWCDRSRADCVCLNDPNGIPADHWTNGLQRCAYCRKPIESADLEMRRIISRNWKDTGFKSPERPYHRSKGCGGYDQMAHEG